MMERFHPPPPPSLPREAPWREIEEVIYLLRDVSYKLDLAISQMTGAAPPAAPTPTPTGVTFPGLPGITLPTPVAPAFDGRLDTLLSLLEMPLEQGKATGGLSTKLVHRGKQWAADMWAGYEVAIKAGTGAGQVSLITSNDKDSLTVSPAWVIGPDPTSFYVIRFRPITQIRWGIGREPVWEYGDEATMPLAEQALVTKTVSLGKTGRVFGVHISAGEANQFRLYQGSAVKQRFDLSSAGTILIVLANPLIDSIVAGTAVSIKVVTAAAADIVYQANLLYDEA